MNGSSGPVLRIDQCGPETLSGRYIRLFWTPFALLDDVLPGRAKDLEILGEHFTYAQSMGILGATVMIGGAIVTFLGPEAHGVNFRKSAH